VALLRKVRPLSKPTLSRSGLGLHDVGLGATGPERHRRPARSLVTVGLTTCVLAATLSNCGGAAQQRGAVPTELPVLYSGEFTYPPRGAFDWQTKETLEIPVDVLRRLATRSAFQGAAGSLPDQLEPGSPPSQIPSSLGSGWNLAVRFDSSGALAVYRRTKLSRILPGPSRVVDVGQVQLPAIEYDGTTFVPDDQSTITITAPRGLISATRPQGRKVSFGANVIFTVPLSGLAATGDSAQIAFNAQHLRPSSLTRIGHGISSVLEWIWGEMVWILGLAVAALVAKAAPTLLDRWGRRTTSNSTEVDTPTEMAQRPLEDRGEPLSGSASAPHKGQPGKDGD
jgi:hypothetical protein